MLDLRRLTAHCRANGRGRIERPDVFGVAACAHEIDLVVGTPTGHERDRAARGEVDFALAVNADQPESRALGPGTPGLGPLQTARNRSERDVCSVGAPGRIDKGFGVAGSKLRGVAR